MIGYTLFGTRDLARAAAFYDAVLGELGAKRAMEMERFVSWRTTEDSGGFGVCLPYDGKQASVGNGSMIALLASTPEQVQAVYNKAIELGGTDEGPPGTRFGNFYAAYFRDLDGNKLNCFCLLSAQLGD
jgi:catechol 2,3-dioxygenase-like lactoylglutathione lyase family enzyme